MVLFELLTAAFQQLSHFMQFCMLQPILLSPNSKPSVLKCKSNIHEQTYSKVVLTVKAHSHQARLRPSTSVYVRCATRVDGRRRASTGVDARLRPSTRVYVRGRAWFGHAFHLAWIVIRSRHLIKMASDSDSDVDELLIFSYFHTRRRTVRQRRAVWIYDTIRKRRQLGEYHRLVNELREDSFRFKCTFVCHPLYLINYWH